jgi:hypothetical protein
VDLAPPIPYRQAVGEMLGADLLLVFQGPNFNSQIPAKVYEYLRAGRPILGLVDPKGDTAAQLRQFEATLLADIRDESDIAGRLGDWLRLRDGPGMPGQLERNIHAVRRYSRSSHAQALARLFDDLI